MNRNGNQMPDREKVLTWLETCGKNRDCSGNCPYSGPLCGEDDESRCREDLMADALALLEKQRAIPPHYTRLEYLVNGKVVEIHHPECPRCFENGLFLWDAEVEKGQAYCKRCGQAVKWDADREKVLT